MTLRLPPARLHRPSVCARWLARCENRVHAPVSTTTVQRVLAVAIVPMVAVTAWLALSSDHLVHPVASALYWST